MLKRLIIATYFLTSTLFIGTITADNIEKQERKIFQKLETWENPLTQQWGHIGRTSIDSVAVHRTSLKIYFPNNAAYVPIRESLMTQVEHSIQMHLGRKWEVLDVSLFAGSTAFEDLIPNVYRDQLPIDTARLSRLDDRKPFIRRVDREMYAGGLSENNIALWHSHGWYYESELDRWEWQRARLFQTVEDISTMGYVLPYIVPMLENAGATVFLPRERDVSSYELIVDDTKSSTGCVLKFSETNLLKREVGFEMRDTLFAHQNPFQMGQSLLLKRGDEGQLASYQLHVEQTGTYSVYVSYQHHSENSEHVVYTINHSGGATSFEVNQTMGGGTWIHLGAFQFNYGQDASIDVFADGEQVSLDAVKIGGGMGHVARRPSATSTSKLKSLKSENKNGQVANEINPESYSWKQSQRPRYLEAARYWLQYAGMPDSMVYSVSQYENDYNDDYKSRGEWVNYLMGAPNGPTDYADAQGLDIPIDLAFAFHTDAGVTKNDSTIGTLAIYSTKYGEKRFPNHQDKMASRDLSDVIQTEIVNDIRLKYDQDWTRRGMWDKAYSEAWRPNVPTMLLELLSHQNLADAKLGLDPRFRFDVSRSIYKGMVKFIAMQESRPYTIQPLPVQYLSIVQSNTNHYMLTWAPQSDPLEPTADATHYKVYRRMNDGGFDNGTVVEGNSFEFELEVPNQIVSYKVSALNAGGESFASEVVACGRSTETDNLALVVNLFDRVCAPEIIDYGDFAGIAHWKDQGVADGTDITFVGDQYDFERAHPWIDDDNTGWGASYADSEGRIVQGNTHDYIMIHGKSLLEAGYSFISCSDEYFESKELPSNIQVLDILAGEERKTAHINRPGEDVFSIFTPQFIEQVSAHVNGGGDIIFTGAYVGTDLFDNPEAIVFAQDKLHYIWRTNYAIKKGGIVCTDAQKVRFDGEFDFEMGRHGSVYGVESPDAIEPSDGESETVLRYQENYTSAGVLYLGPNYGSFVMGIPFETIESEDARHELMKQILKSFE